MAEPCALCGGFSASMIGLGDVWWCTHHEKAVAASIHVLFNDLRDACGPALLLRMSLARIDADAWRIEDLRSELAKRDAEVERLRADVSGMVQIHRENHLLWWVAEWADQLLAAIYEDAPDAAPAQRHKLRQALDDLDSRESTPPRDNRMTEIERERDEARAQLADLPRLRAVEAAAHKMWLLALDLYAHDFNNKYVREMALKITSEFESVAMTRDAALSPPAEVKRHEVSVLPHDWEAFDPEVTASAIERECRRCGCRRIVTKTVPPEVVYVMNHEQYAEPPLCHVAEVKPPTRVVFGGPQVVDADGNPVEVLPCVAEGNGTANQNRCGGVAMSATAAACLGSSSLPTECWLNSDVRTAST